MNRITSNQLVKSFDANNPPDLKVHPAEPFVMETNDRFASYGGSYSTSETMETLETLAGPVYIEGAKPRDILNVEVKDGSLPLDYA